MKPNKLSPKREQVTLTPEQYKQANLYAMKVLMPLFFIITGSIAVFVGIVMVVTLI